MFGKVSLCFRVSFGCCLHMSEVCVCLVSGYTRNSFVIVSVQILFTIGVLSCYCRQSIGNVGVMSGVMSGDFVTLSYLVSLV